jgi:hypothetical protein
LLRSNLEERFNGDVVLKDVSSVFSQVIEVAGNRNLIVHNPLFMDVFADDGGNLKLSPSIRSLRDYEKGVTLSELQDINSKALKAVDNLQHLDKTITDKLFL